MSPTNQPGCPEAQGDDAEDDYMNMTFDDPAPATESSLQRTQRLKKESRARGVIKSKAQLAEEEAAARDKALATSLLDDPRRAKTSKGLAMMARMGFAGGGLGKKEADGTARGRTEPIHLSLKDDRGGVGMDAEKKRRFREVAEEVIGSDAKVQKLDPDEYRERVRREREDAKLEKQFLAAQRLVERMDEEEDGDGGDASASEDDAEGRDKGGRAPRPISSRPLRSVPVLYRGLVRHREEKERDRRMRYDLEQSLSRLPAYEEEDDDPDYKTALGKRGTVYAVAEDLDEEDPELDAFNAVDVHERLERLLKHLREQHRYCFWCKMVYPDAKMDGCPGLTEEDHD
ncbi:D111/G-patch [Cordyceps fumosorosea ARSEF 2679]|uniref:D111/G-patch n=1 Tax=Cordyceps fumosorosea (strain ARSEF 2679) TaxID=1081104 RepID=A0A168EMR7_CORFA|nr:D111/G-patch [Cordyceps fumosorosea ARSEF 2679]OAA73997.1 D111/G-patch [Cordyceps fumosorosea ARSEF 2679]